MMFILPVETGSMLSHYCNMKDWIMSVSERTIKPAPVKSGGFLSLKASFYRLAGKRNRMFF